MVNRLALVLLVSACSLSGDKTRCETQSDCLDGYTCNAGTCEHPTMSTCTPITCEGHCGVVDDHCEGTIDCGACPDHCTNSAKDPTETDVDCGGDCMPCAPGLRCAHTSDCTSGTCDVDTCRAGTWSTVAAMPTARTELAAVAAADGKIYVIGGRTGSSPSAVVEVYDPALDSWTSRAPMATPRYGFAAVLGSDGRIYTLGGEYTSVSNAGPSVVAEVYDPVTNAWASLPSLPGGRYHVAAAVAGNGVIYALAGFDGTTFHTLSSVATWQLGATSWTTLPDAMTTARNSHVAATLPDGRIYALGGQDNNGTELAAFEYFQPGSAGWSTLLAMPTARTSFAAAPLGTSLYAISGSRFSANTPYTRVVEVYDTTAHTWSQVTSIPNGRYGHAAVALGGRLYVLGGRREAGDANTAIVDVYTP